MSVPPESTGAPGPSESSRPSEPPRPSESSGLSEPPRPSTNWQRILVASVAVIAVLLVGAAAGLLIAQARPSSSASAAPAADSVAVGFCQDMTVHHRQAIRMAGLARDRSTDPVIKGLAFDIETNQLEQVGRMQGWLNLWGRDPLPVGGNMAWMSDASPTHGHTGSADGAVAKMPGMASEDELTRLTQLTGRDLDVLFLQLMLRHHQGGISMMRYAAEHAEAGVVRNLASQMADSQASETELLTKWITERGGTPLPPPN